MKKQTCVAMSPEKLFTVKLILLCVALTVATTLYLIGLINFVCLLLIVLGSLWNFFAKINSILGFVLCLGTCVIFGFESISIGLYSHAVLYLLFYVVLELVVIILNFKGNTIFVRYKNLSPRESYFILLAMILFFMSGFAVSLYQNNMIFPAVDAVCCSMLALSAYLHAKNFREYYFVRPIALVLTIAMFSHIISIGFKGSITISMLMLYVIYFALDFVEHLFLFSSKHKTRHSIRNVMANVQEDDVQISNEHDDFQNKKDSSEKKQRKSHKKDISA